MSPEDTRLNKMRPNTPPHFKKIFTLLGLSKSELTYYQPLVYRLSGKSSGSATQGVNLGAWWVRFVVQGGTTISPLYFGREGEKESIVING